MAIILRERNNWMKWIMKSEKKWAYIWNSASGMISAGQSAIIVIFITRCLGITEAGVFTIAYALANLISVFAKCGIRNFQVTDIEEEFSLKTYLGLRVVSILISILLLAGYLLLKINGQEYTFAKSIVIGGICIWKLVDAMEDVFIGAYQQKNQLSVGAFYYTLRLFITTCMYCAFIVKGFNLICATVVTVIISAVMCTVFCAVSFSKFTIQKRVCEGGTVKKLIKIGFPLCIGTTLANYIGNAPKYAIDRYMDDSAQAYFGYIMMPSFVILLLSNFIYQPLIRNLGVLWGKESKKSFMRTVFRQFIIVLGLTIIAMMTGAWLGIPILSYIYGVNLSLLKKEFLLLLAGGGIYAMVSYLTVVLTTIRMQKWLAAGFITATILYGILGSVFAKEWSIMGVALLYLLLNILLVVWFTICLFLKVKLCSDK